MLYNTKFVKGICYIYKYNIYINLKKPGEKSPFGSGSLQVYSALVTREKRNKLIVRVIVALLPQNFCKFNR